MSMRDYAVDDYGLALNETTVNDIASRFLVRIIQKTQVHIGDTSFMKREFANI